MNLNNVNIMGNLTRNPEIKHISPGKAVCNLSIANNRVFIKNGEKMTEVSFFDVDVWGTAAENCSKYLMKGSGVIVEGRLRQDRWEKDGKTQSRVRITASAIHFMPKKQSHALQHASVLADDSQTEIKETSLVSPEDVNWEE